LTPGFRQTKAKERAARKVLAMWRGYKARKNRPPQMREIAERLCEARKNVDRTKTVGHLIISSMKFLKGKYNSNEALSVLQKLQNISRIVPHLFIDHADFIARFCYGMMAQSIRSEVDKLIIELCACVILNLSRFGPTKEASFHQDGLVTVAQMLLRWCDKECGIFNTLCSLIYVFSYCEDKKMVSCPYKFNLYILYSNLII
jgi:abnormal spindle-like microcephaly-associated protein